MWDNVERLLRIQLGRQLAVPFKSASRGKPRVHQKALEKFIGSLQQARKGCKLAVLADGAQEQLTSYCRDQYKRFFQLVPRRSNVF